MISVISVSATQAAGIADLTDERGGPHAIQCLVEDVEIALRNALRCPLLRQPSRRCFDSDHGPSERAQLALGAARLEGERRSQVLVSAPALVVRPSRAGDGAREASHELTVLRIRTGRPLTAESVDAMVHTVLPAVLPEHSFHIEELSGTTDSVRVIVRDEQCGAVIVGACGVMQASGLAGISGIDAAATTVIALELRLDALVMLRKGIDDVRLLWSNDPFVARQMRDLGRFRPGVAADWPAGSPQPAAP